MNALVPVHRQKSLGTELAHKPPNLPKPNKKLKPLKTQRPLIT